MAANHSRTLPNDPELAVSYAPLLDQSQSETSSSSSDQRRRPIKVLAGIFLSSLFLLTLVVLTVFQQPHDHQAQAMNANLDKSSSFPSSSLNPPSRGVSQGVSEKTFRDVFEANDVFPWTNAMLSWQRTSYHFQPEKNWMNDPNGPLFHMDWYHLFYQYNPDSAIWGNITWGHAVSRDLIHWLYLPLAMVPDRPFDINGVWTGSATTLPDGKIVILYTGDNADLVQVQNLAYPANLSDPLLLDWIKYPGNPVMVPPPGIGKKDFRDPTTAWLAPDGKKWLVTLGSKINKTGIALVYETSDFKSYRLLDGVLHSVPHTGMWECVDFYPVSTVEDNGLDTSANGPGTKHVLKASLDDDKHDYYALGAYDPYNSSWTPDNRELDVGIGLRVDYGKYYASKTFYDQSTKRRILWGWTGETDSEATDLLKGWASVQTIPRNVVFDKKTGTNILQWPVEEVEKLRFNATEFDNIKLEPGSIVPLNIGSATQLDIIASFEVDSETLEATVEADVGYNCTTSGGAAGRGKLGPFGLLVFADDSLSELTPVYYYISKGTDGTAETHFCADESRSSEAPNVGKLVYGSTIPVLDGEKFNARLLVDHSIIESFGQGGRAVITSRVYPTKAIYGAARLFFFNNATGVSVTASAKIWHMQAADIRPFSQL
ncbi:hypothetical protein ACH5RR_019576 [Cinchona calisaya]|uniref:beta-fructofuranosidase n=1 Tax=Cinchona calisaya TaxID=153742 RepID=A0ABD2ZPS5_9GENT